MRYAPWVRQRCGQVKLLAKPELIPALKTAFQFDEILDPKVMPSLDTFDRYAGLTELPGIFRTFVDGQAPPPPLAFTPPPDKVASWKETLDAEPGYRVGVVWRGSPDNALHPVRDIPPAYFKPLSQVQGVRLVTLQQTPRQGEVGKIGRKKAVTDLTAHLGSVGWDILDTAAVIQNLNLVITCDSMVGHLAGSMGKDTWILLPRYPDWRWGLNGTGTPWYSSVTLFRQDEIERWEKYLKEKVAPALAARPDVQGLPAI